MVDNNGSLLAIYKFHKRSRCRYPGTYSLKVILNKCYSPGR